MWKFAIIVVGTILAAEGFAGEPRKPARRAPMANFPSLGGHMTPLPASNRLPEFALQIDRAVYRGSVYRLDPELEADGVAVGDRKRILSLLTEADFIPAERLRYFAWCDDPELAVTGWSGYVEALIPNAGGWEARVRISPRLARASSVATITGDFAIERFFIGRNGHVRILGCENSPWALRGSLFDF